MENAAPSIWFHRRCSTGFGTVTLHRKLGQTKISIQLVHDFYSRNDSRDDEAEVAEWAKWNVENDGFIFSGEKANRRRYPRRQGRTGKTYGLSILLDPNLDEYFCTTSDAMGFRVTVTTLEGLFSSKFDPFALDGNTLVHRLPSRRRFRNIHRA